MTEPERTPRKWHESLAGVLETLIFAAIVTSPCWGLALIAWVRK